MLLPLIECGSKACAGSDFTGQKLKQQLFVCRSPFPQRVSGHMLLDTKPQGLRELIASCRSSAVLYATGSWPRPSWFGRGKLLHQIRNQPSL